MTEIIGLKDLKNVNKKNTMKKIFLVIYLLIAGNVNGQNLIATDSDESVFPDTVELIIAKGYRSNEWQRTDTAVWRTYQSANSPYDTVFAPREATHSWIVNANGKDTMTFISDGHKVTIYGLDTGKTYVLSSVSNAGLKVDQNGNVGLWDGDRKTVFWVFIGFVGLLIVLIYFLINRKNITP